MERERERERVGERERRREREGEREGRREEGGREREGESTPSFKRLCQLAIYLLEYALRKNPTIIKVRRLMTRTTLING